MQPSPGVCGELKDPRDKAKKSSLGGQIGLLGGWRTMKVYGKARFSCCAEVCVAVCLSLPTVTHPYSCLLLWQHGRNCHGLFGAWPRWEQQCSMGDDQFIVSEVALLFTLCHLLTPSAGLVPPGHCRLQLLPRHQLLLDVWRGLLPAHGYCAHLLHRQAPQVDVHLHRLV